MRAQRLRIGKEGFTPAANAANSGRRCWRTGSALMLLVLLPGAAAHADDLGARARALTQYATEPGEAQVQGKNPNAGAYLKFKIWGGSSGTPTNLAFRLDSSHVGTLRCEGQDKACDEDDDCDLGFTEGKCVTSVCGYNDVEFFPLSVPNPCPNSDTCLVNTDDHGATPESDCGCEISFGEWIVPPNTPDWTNYRVCNMHHHYSEEDSTCSQTCDDQGRCMLPANDMGAYITEISFDGSVCWIPVASGDNDLQWDEDPPAGCGTLCDSL